jgi:decaprenylphospho-beta-D-ribofuranose 2-oxidase
LAYGDAALNAGGRVIAMNRLNRILAFDTENGLIICEAGVTLGDILDVCVPRGWFLAVTPGTARATAAGCLACDVHGKNHHLVGSFSRRVASATILVGNGEVMTCGSDQNSELFWATAGGMGLTGAILELTLRLQRIQTAYIHARNIVARNLDETFRKLEETTDATYSAAWVDGVARGSRFGRGVIMLGEHAGLTEIPAERRTAPLVSRTRRQRSLPVGLPSAMLSRSLALMLNEAIYLRYATGTSQNLVDARRYTYPLDAFDNWNLLFGASGFLEYQVVLPLRQAFDGIKRILETVDRAGAVSFFTAIKRLGESAPAHLSFPMPGYAFSFSVPAGEKKTFALLNRCDEVTVALGGRVYLAKDARLEASTLAAMYARISEWRAIARRYDRAGVLASDMSRRLGLTS